MRTARLLPVSPSVHCPGGGYLPLVRGGGVSAPRGVPASGWGGGATCLWSQGCLLPGGGCLLPGRGGYLHPVPGGVCSQGGYLPLVEGGVYSRGCIPTCKWADPPPRGQNDRHVKTKPSQTWFAGGNNIQYTCRSLRLIYGL